jgi:RNA polymerase sigma factor (sigma-70 family)
MEGDEAETVTPLTEQQQKWVLEAEPSIVVLSKRLRRKFPRAREEDIAQTLWTGYAEVAPRYNPAEGSFAAFAYWPAWGKAIDELTREARQSPLHMARKALGAAAEPLRVATGPYMEDSEILAPIKAACREGTFRMFFGATLDTWRTQGEEGLVDHLTRLTAFRALQSAFATLTPDEWKLLELYYIECLTWKVVGAAFDISDRQARRRDEDIREKLKAELMARGVETAPPEAA